MTAPVSSSETASTAETTAELPPSHSETAGRQPFGPPAALGSSDRVEPPKWLRRFLYGVLLIDVVAGLLAGCLSFLLRFGDPTTPEFGYVIASAALPLLWVAGIAVTRGYAVRELGTGTEEFRRVAHACVGLVALVAVVSYATKLEIARGYVVLAIPLAAALSISGRYLARKRLHVLRRVGGCMKNVVAVGRQRAVLDLVHQTRREWHCGMRVVAACVPNPQDAELLRAVEVPVAGDLDQVLAVTRAVGADAVAVTSDSDTGSVFLRKLSWELEGSGVELLVAPGLVEVAGPRLHIRPFVGLPLLHVEEPEFAGLRRVFKGGIDRFAAGLVLALLSPFLLIIAAAVRLTDGGPALFRQTRIGRDGKPFTMIKFRTMYVDAEQRKADLAARNQHGDNPMFKMRDDPRVTRIGKYLRRYSVDEIPQLINVLRGTMSLVGPRPPLPQEVELYDASARRRLLVKPGLTGLWQVSGRSNLAWEEAVRLDLRYVENWSLTLDLLILWKTLFAVINGRGAY